MFHSVLEFLKTIEQDLVGEEKVVVAFVESEVAKLFAEVFTHNAPAALTEDQQKVLNEKVVVPLQTQFPAVDPPAVAHEPTDEVLHTGGGF